MKNGTFAGRVGQKAVVRATAGGQSVTNFSVAVDRGKDRDTGEKLAPMWVKATMWGERGKKIAQYILPGIVVAISGEIDLDSYEKDGNTISQVICRVDQFSFLGGGQKNEDESEEESEDGCPI
jgi:single-strand DNA-binding protein